MTKRTTHTLRASLGSPQTLKRAALYASGAALGAVVSVTVSYALVSMIFPRQAAPAAIAYIRPDVALPAGSAPAATLASAPATVDIDVTPLDTAPSEIAAPQLAAVAPSAVITPEAAPAAPAAVTDIAIAPRAETVATALPETAPDAGTQDIATPADIATPENFAALASADTAARTGATLDFAASDTSPAVRPDVVSSAAADMPGTRPSPRPDYLIPAVVTADVLATIDDIPAVRPKPRPDSVRVAAVAAVPAPAAAPTTPAPAATTVSAPSGGLFGLNFGGGGTCGKSLTRAMPRRSAGAAGGTAFFGSLGNLSGPERDARVTAELGRGNMPRFLHNLKPVTFRGQDRRGVETEIVICVTPDYLALGSNSDYVRTPLGLPAAARIAGRFGMTLPTPRMVDAIYAQADVKLSPSPMQAGPQMSSTAYLLRHNATIQGQLHGRTGLIAGDKKDVVMASRLASAPGRVAIYGWHRSASSPIQPVSTVHGKNYADYSHGIRLVSKTAYLNGKAVKLDDLLESSRYAYLLNKEGPLPGPVIRTASR